MGALIAFGAILILGLVFLIIRSRTSESQSLEDRLNELAAMGQPVTLEELELSQPFTERVINPMLEGLAQMAKKFTPESAKEATRHRIELAGLAGKLTPEQYSAYRLGAAIGIALLGGGIALFVHLPFLQRLLIPMGAMAIGYYLPNMYLSSLTSKRQKEILKALPDAMDLLTICVEAGLGFDAAMSKVAEKWDNELSRSFQRVVQEMQLGKLRREALRSLAYSVEVSDVTTFVAAIVQADQLGVSMAKVMRIQSDTMRLKRRQRAEEKARQAPVKMMIPLVFFIFPSIFIILLGPAAIIFKNMDSS